MCGVFTQSNAGQLKSAIVVGLPAGSVSEHPFQTGEEYRQTTWRPAAFELYSSRYSRALLQDHFHVRNI
jgi:hypothetical protein